jgi:O-antigen/teichoic acid export membrane protein
MAPLDIYVDGNVLRLFPSNFVGLRKNGLLLMNPRLFPLRYIFLSITGLNILKQTALTWAVVIAGLMIGQGIGALSLIVIARKVPAVSLGQYLACWGLANLLVILPNFGLENWLLTRGLSGKALAAHLWQESLTPRLSLLLVWLCLMIVSGYILPRDTYPLAIMFPVVLSASLDSLTLLTYAAFRVAGIHHIVALLQCTFSLALLAVTLSLPAQPDIFVRFAITKAGLSAANLLVVSLIVRGWKTGRITSRSARDVLTSATPFAVSDIAAITCERAGLAIVPVFLGAASTGIYGPALNILQFVFLIPRALFLIVTPVLSREYISDRRLFRRIAAAQLVGQMISGLALSAGIVLLTPFIIQLSFGEAYRDSAAVLRLLGLVPFFKSANFAFASMLASADLQHQRTQVQIVCAMITVIADLIAVVLLGLVGPVIMHTVSELLLCAGYFWIVQHNLWRSFRPA